MLPADLAVTDVGSAWQDGDVREEAGYVDVDGDAVFCVTHVPTGTITGSAVIVGPLLAELVANYRREVDLARSLARLGVAVRRFHFRGAGRSRGELADMTFDSMVADTIRVTEDFAAMTNIDQPVMVGTRLGGVVAAAGSDGHGLVLWEPVLDTRRYFREIMQSLQLHALKEGQSGPTDSLESMLDAHGFADVFGYPIHRKLVDSLADIDPMEILARVPQPTLVLRITPTGKLGSRYERLVAALAARGSDVQTELIAGQEAWWFSTGQGKQRQADPSSALVERTRSWILSMREN